MGMRIHSLGMISSQEQFDAFIMKSIYVVEGVFALHLGSLKCVKNIKRLLQQESKAGPRIGSLSSKTSVCILPTRHGWVCVFRRPPRIAPNRC